MTDREKAIVMAYTGACMLTGDKFKIFHGYVEDIMDRPIWTHEMGIESIADEIKKKSKADFVALCEDKLESGHWIKKKGMIYCSECGDGFDVFTLNDPFKYCPSCGMRNEVEETETCKGCMNKCIMYEPNMKGCKDKMVEPQESEDEE